MSRPHPLVTAAGLFTVIPVPPVTMITADVARRAIRWFPALGFLLGLAAAGVATLTLFLSESHLLAAALAIACLQALVGGMHLDGLADTADGLAAIGSRKQGRDASSALDIMRKPDIGAMGVATIALVLAIQMAAISALPDWRSSAVVLLLFPVVERLSVLLATRPGIPSARPGGFGALMSEITPRGHVLGQVAVWLTVAAALGWLAAGGPGAVVLPGSAIVALVVGAALTRRMVTTLGGMTGDCFGALVEASGAAFLVVAALAW